MNFVFTFYTVKETNFDNNTLTIIFQSFNTKLIKQLQTIQ